MGSNTSKKERDPLGYYVTTHECNPPSGDMNCTADPETGQCTLKSTAKKGATQHSTYGFSTANYFNWNKSSKGAWYCTDKGECVDGYFFDETPKGQKDLCLTKSSEQLSITECCTGQTPIVDEEGQIDGKYDSRKCGRSENAYDPDNVQGSDGFAPWSFFCTQDDEGLAVIQNFCSVLADDSDECTVNEGEDPGVVCEPRVTKYSNCSIWCEENPVNCEAAMKEFCKAYPQNPACACIGASKFGDQSQLYSLLQSQEQASPGCWWSPCANPSDPNIYVPPEDINPSCPDSVCNNIIEIIDNNDVDINMVNQYVSCDGGDINVGGALTTLDIIVISLASLILVVVIAVILWWVYEKNP